MKSKIIYLLFFTTISLYLFHFLFFWIYETTDSYFFWAFADFLKTGKYWIPHPYYWTTPSTIAPPLYSVLLFVAEFLPRADIFIHFIHLLCLFLSSFFIYRITKSYLGRKNSLITALIYLLIPANIFQSLSLMSEMISLLGLSLFLYLGFLILEKKQNNLIKYLLISSSFMVLARYNFIIFWIISGILFFLIRNKKISDYLFLVLSVFIIAGWVGINYILTGNIGLSDSVGKHLYNRIVYENKLLPPENNKYLKELRRLASENFDLYVSAWELDPQIIVKLGLDQKRENKLLANVAIDGVKTNPLSYVYKTLENFFKVHGNGQTYPGYLYTTDYWMKEKCRVLGTIHFCQPIISHQLGNEAWNKLLLISEWYYQHIPLYTNFFLLYPSLIFSLIQKNKYLRFTGLLYLLMALFTLSVEIPVYRYQYILYPLKIILFTYLMSYLYNIKKYKRNKSGNNSPTKSEIHKYW
ncbi:hypothetical protein A3D03_00540 [Candidatus Gottesmanbacteria bacterium RIFCSPHIGHO2_02_FULL_40_13]|uniref:Glycosyltransferase RgtA/B/C/D-like domain-containing protein n=1 Tax=Candidatus Gottesmanbacteria bacterium RIFCSPHIGHO2_02_FULL_40_13 TaxID=1798384 RepID=A0A1F6A6G2_9BACT|nr:MAG: hypothetical protein A3D03_00540 [Candidatus Gottesmanbacteria bacterium RIFCSPHIGHO2_02_FULL_40_13]